jgi:addiction module HigA family antidote
MMKEIHPGEILQEEFIEPHNISLKQLAAELRWPAGRMDTLLNGRVDINEDMATDLGRYFGVEPNFWLNLQSEYDRRHQKRSFAKRLSEMPNVGNDADFSRED